MRRFADRIALFLLLAAFFIVILWAAGMDAQDAALAEAHYCRMVETYDETGGEFGWPDFKQIKEQCND